MWRLSPDKSLKMDVTEVLIYGGCHFRNCSYDYMMLLSTGSSCHLSQSATLLSQTSAWMNQEYIMLKEIK